MKHLLTLLCIGAFLSAEAADRDSANFYFKKGLEEKGASRYMAASQAFDKAIQFNQNYIEAYVENGLICMVMKKTDKAKTCFSKVYELQPDNAVALRELTELFYNYRQYEKAIEFAQKCNGYANSERIMGISYYQLEDYPSSVTVLKKYLSKNSNDAEATYILARTYLEMEDFEKSVLVYEKAVSLDNTKNSWQYELGLLYYTLNDYQKAMNSMILASNNGYPQSNDFKENLGYASLYSGQYEKGEQLLMEVWSRKMGNKDILRVLAELLYQQRQFDRSLYYCQKLMEMDSKDGKALYQAGLNFQKMGQKDKGQQMCDKAIEMDPSLAGLRKKRDIPGM